MRILLIIISLMAFTNVSSQSLAELMEKYQAECDRTVTITVKQIGTVHYEYLPVKDNKNKVLHYVISVKDTVWTEPMCPEYKYPIIQGWTGSGNITFADETYGAELYSLDAGKVTFSHNGTIVGETIKSEVTKDYDCYCKERQVDKFSDHFWDWVVKQNRK